MVEFTDGSTLAQASPPDMRLPISLALGWPDRVPGRGRRLRLDRAGQLDFEPLDEDGVPGRPAGPARPAPRGGAAPAVYNAANEVGRRGVPRRQRCRSSQIVDTVADVLEEHARIAPDRRAVGRLTLDDVLARRRLGAGPGGRELLGRMRRMTGLGWLGVVAFVVGILLSVMIHECGHFVTATPLRRAR